MAEVIRLNPADEVPQATFSIEAEQQILGALLLHNEMVGAVVEEGGASLFFEPTHCDLFEKIRGMERDGILASPVTLREWASEHAGAQDLGGARYLARLAGASVTPSLIRDYAQHLAELALRRSILEAADAARAELIRGDEPGANIAARLEAAICNVDGGQRTGLVSMMRAATEAMDGALKARAGEDDGRVETGVPALDTMIGGLHPGELILLGGRPSMGKAQPLDSSVLMADGRWKRMGDIGLGDRVASPDGRPSRVAGIYPKGERQVFKVTFSDGRSVRCCGEHLWKIRSSRFKGDRVVDTDEIKRLLATPRYRRRISVPLVSGHFGHDGDLPVDPWLLGVLLGNGALTSGHCGVSTADAETLWRVQEAIGCDHRLASNGAYDYRISADTSRENAVLSGLRALGVYGCLSTEKFIPARYMSAGRDTRLNLLRGLMDTDGWVETFGAVRFSTSSARLAEGFAGLVRSLGGICKVAAPKTPKFNHNGETRVGAPHYVCSVRHDDAGDFFNLIRKKRRCKRVKPALLTICDVEPDGVEPVQCIAVSHPDHLYVTDGYTVTHNTALSINIAINAARQGHGVAFCSLEMMPDAIAIRAISEEMGECGVNLPYRDIRAGQWQDAQAEALRSAAASVADLPIYMLPREYADIGALMAGAKRAKAMLGGNLKLLVVDYVQLMRDQRAKNRYELITEVSTALKLLAGRLGVPVLALSQLSRAVEQRDDKRPMLSDLRESGQLEQDADTVMFCYRDEYYIEREAPPEHDLESQADWHAALDRSRNRLEIIVAKQRQGPIGTAHVMCDVACNRVWDALDRGRG